MRRLSLAAAIVVLGALVFSAGARACSCAQMTPAEAMRQADAAIVGRLVNVVPRGRVQADYRYRVQRVYKGGGEIREGRVISVRSASASSACGLPSRTGRSYGLLLNEASAGPREGAERGAAPGHAWTGGLCGVVAPRKLRSAPVGGGGRGRAAQGPGYCAS